MLRSYGSLFRIPDTGARLSAAHLGLPWGSPAPSPFVQRLILLLNLCFERTGRERTRAEQQVPTSSSSSESY